NYLERYAHRRRIDVRADAEAASVHRDFAFEQGLRRSALSHRDRTPQLDKGYDLATIYHGCEQRNVRPIIPLRQTPDLKAGKDKPPTCEHGEWRFAGSDSKRGGSKWRCPTSECKPPRCGSSFPAAPLIPRETPR